jgi:hypothetical protein
MNSRGRTELELSFTGNYKCVSQFNDIISNLSKLHPRNITSNGSVYRIRWSNKEEIIKILEIMYADCNEHKLLRKYNKFLEIKENTEVN